MQIIPTYNRILLKRVEEKKISKSGLILPDEKKRHNICEIVEIGFEVEDWEIGDKVLIKDYVGCKISIDEEELLIIEKEEILAQVYD